MNTQPDQAPGKVSSKGFKRFWKHAGKPSTVGPSEVVTQEAANLQDSHYQQQGQRSTSELSTQSASLLYSESSKTIDEADTSRRRQQVYNAQKRHRSRKNEYIRSLESELNNLRRLEVVVATQRDKLAMQNAHMRSVLEEHQQSSRSLSHEQVPFVTVSVQHDNQTQHERVVLEVPGSQSQASPSIHSPGTREAEDTWAAMDFILSLEWPCRSHIQHPITYHPTEPRLPHGTADYTGHGLTTTSKIVSGCLHQSQVPVDQLPSHEGIDEDILKKWQLPYAEIEKLIHLAESLELATDRITPAQAYSAIKAQCPETMLLKTVLGTMKARLAELTHCKGFGAVIDAELFKQHLAAVMQQHL